MHNYFCLQCNKTWISENNPKKCKCGGKLKRIGKVSGIGFKGTQEQGKQTKRNKI